MPSTSRTPIPSSSRRRNPPGPRTKVRPRSGKGGRPRGAIPMSERLERSHKAKEAKQQQRHIKRNYKELRRQVFAVLGREEVEELARECGFYRREPREIRAFEFAVCSALAAVVEGKRSFASVWRLMVAAAGIKVHRSAVTQRFGAGSARLMETLVERVAKRVSKPDCPEMLGRLAEFKAVLAHDGSVVKLSPLLKTLFPARRTTSMEAAARVHGTVDLVNRQMVRAVVTGDRDSELVVARTMPIEANVLYMSDLGYTSYAYLYEIADAGGELVSRLKTNANPKIVEIRHGVFAPQRTLSLGYGLNHPELRFPLKGETFDLDARFETKETSVVLRVVGVWDKEQKAYHQYVTTLSSDNYSPYDIAQIYRLRWVIELLFKLLKSSCHLDHVDTSDPEALRTHIFSSILASLLLSELSQIAARDAGLHPSLLSPLVVGIAAPIIVLPILLLWLERDLTPEALWDCIIRLLVIGCRDQNPKRTKRYWEALNRS